MRSLFHREQGVLAAAGDVRLLKIAVEVHPVAHHGIALHLFRQKVRRAHQLTGSLGKGDIIPGRFFHIAEAPERVNTGNQQRKCNDEGHGHRQNRYSFQG